MATALVAGLAIALLWTAGGLELWEAKTWDWRVRVMAQPGPATEDIALILVDQNSLDWASQVNNWPWPWPREVIGAIVNHCQRQGAKALALDILFTEPSRYGVGDDQALGAAIQGFSRVCGAVFLGQKSGAHSQWPAGIDPPDFAVAGLEAWLAQGDGSGLSSERAAFPIPELGQNTRMLCNVGLQPDPDGVYRRIPPFALFEGHPVPSLGLGAYLIGKDISQAEIGPNQLHLGGLSLPLSDCGDLLLCYRGKAGTIPSYSAASVLQAEIRHLSGEADPEKPSPFKDKYLFLGYSAPGLYDLRPAPVGGVYPGVEIHATFLDNLLSGDFIRMAPLWLDLMVIFGIALASAASVAFFHSTRAIIALCGLCLALPLPLSLWAYEKGFWLQLLAPQGAGGIAVLLGLAVNYATEGRQKRFIKQAFGQYLSPAVIENLIQQPDQLQLGGVERELSIFFSDIQGFTAISEGLNPPQLTAFLNHYLTEMTDIITEEGGTVDKYEGDAIIAFWNAPLDLPDHATHCVRAALRCQKRLAQMQTELGRHTGGKPVRMRIGINTGPAVVGNFGSQTKFDYTMIGDAVNLAARLEGINKVFGTYTLISHASFVQCKDQCKDRFPARPLGAIQVVGKAAAVRVYEPMTASEYAEKQARFEIFENGLKLFTQGAFARAEAVFDRIADADPAAAAYMEKCRELIQSPPESWEGHWVMTRK